MPLAASLPPPSAVVFDLGGTLVHWPGWDDDAPRRWRLSYDHLTEHVPRHDWPNARAYVEAMCEAEAAHWARVNHEHWSGPPSDLVTGGLRRLGRAGDPGEVLAALDGYARAVDGTSLIMPSAVETLALLRERGYRLGLLSNTWWAAAWHDADLATHGLADYLHAVVYTSDLPRSKPHASVFREVASRLGCAPGVCVMVGDRPIDDVVGAQSAGMRGVWLRNESPAPRPADFSPTAIIDDLAELPPLLGRWGGA